jgi:hypothetical protein
VDTHSGKATTFSSVAAGIRTVRFQSKDKLKGDLIRKIVLGTDFTESMTTPSESSRTAGQAASDNVGITSIASTAKEDVARSAPFTMESRDR